MTPDRYEASTAGPQRLSGSLQKRGSRMGLPTWGGLLFGVPFVGIGVCTILVGTHVLDVNPTSVRAPYWVLTVAGVSFALAGLMVWGMAGKQFAADRRRRRAAQRYPNEPALADYPWHPDGFDVSEWAGAARTAALAGGLTVFLSMFNWWAFGAGGPWMVKGIVILFDCITVLFWCQAVKTLGRALKFGPSRIQFSRFPYPLGEPVVLRWQPSSGVNLVRHGTFTLRCVREWMESTGSGRDRNTSLVHEALWSGTWLLERPHKLELKDAVELRYELPADAQPTQLSADQPLFWELEVKLDLLGLDFQDTYLVPIYAAEAVTGIKPILLNR